MYLTGPRYILADGANTPQQSLTIALQIRKKKLLHSSKFSYHLSILSLQYRRCVCNNPLAPETRFLKGNAGPVMIVYLYGIYASQISADYKRNKHVIDLQLTTSFTHLTAPIFK